MSRAALSTLLCALGAALGACRGPSIEAEILPFHLAVIPFEGNGADESGLSLDGGDLAQAFAEFLDGLSFSVVTLLPPPQGVSEAEFESWSSERRRAHWLAAAQTCQADLLLQADLRPIERPRSEQIVTAGAYWDGLWKALTLTFFTWQAAAVSGLFTLGRWGVEDRGYHFQAGFDGTLHELEPLLDPTGEASLANRRAELLRVFVYDSDAQLEFHARAGFVGHVLSFLIPPVWLPSSAQAERQALREAVGGHMVEGFVQELEFRKGELLAGNGLYPFEVERLALSAGAGEARLLVVVLLRTESVDALEGYRVWIDGVLTADGEFSAPEPAGPARERYTLDLPLVGLGAGARVRVEIRDGAARQNSRSFTLVEGRTGQRGSKETGLELPRAED